jgi:hypothetical protein
MRRVEVEFGPNRDDTGGVQLLVAAVVVALDVVHVDGLGDAGDLIEVAEIAPEIGAVDDAPPVALEVPDIDRVEAHQRGEQPPSASVSRPPAR